MAYMNQERKKKIADELKTQLKGAGIKYSVAVRHHSAIVITIKSGSIDFIGNYNDTGKAKPDFRAVPIDSHIDVNVYWYKEHFTGEALEVLKKIVSTANIGNHDNSDAMTDYFDVGWYVSVCIGSWNKPYQLTR